MGKILMLYASMTGNTELMAEAIVDYLEQQGYEVDTRTFDFDPIDVEELSNYDAIAVGTHTWDAGSLPYEVEDFYEEVEEVNIEGLIFGVFGSADSFYEAYGTAVEMMWTHLKEGGGLMVPDKVIVDLDPNEDDIERCLQFASTMSDMIKEKDSHKTS